METSLSVSDWLDILKSQCRWQLYVETLAAMRDAVDKMDDERACKL